MSAVKVTIQSTAQYRTEVHVDGKFCFQTNVHPHILKPELQTLFEMVQCDNVEVEVVE